MHINVEHREDYAVLHLRGEFDTYYCRHLQEEVDALIGAGTVYAILNLRMVKFINSTALGAIIKASKAFVANGGKLALSRPSPFCREIIGKVGLDRVVPLYEEDEEAARQILSGTAAPKKKSKGAPEEDESSVLFTPADPERIEHFLSETRRFKLSHGQPVTSHETGKNWRGVGRMASLDERGLRFTWTGGETGLDPFAMGQLLSIGTVLKVKFRMPMFKPGYCDAEATVSEVEERDNGVKIGAAFSKIDEKTLEAVRQYSTDLKFLKEELKKATRD